jgi:hypothetical protein
MMNTALMPNTAPASRAANWTDDPEPLFAGARRRRRRISGSRGCRDGRSGRLVHCWHNLGSVGRGRGGADRRRPRRSIGRVRSRLGGRDRHVNCRGPLCVIAGVERDRGWPDQGSFDRVAGIRTRAGFSGLDFERSGRRCPGFPRAALGHSRDDRFGEGRHYGKRESDRRSGRQNPIRHALYGQHTSLVVSAMPRWRGANVGIELMCAGIRAGARFKQTRSVSGGVESLPGRPWRRPPGPGRGARP